MNRLASQMPLLSLLRADCCQRCRLLNKQLSISIQHPLVVARAPDIPTGPSCAVLCPGPLSKQSGLKTTILKCPQCPRAVMQCPPNFKWWLIAACSFPPDKHGHQDVCISTCGVSGHLQVELGVRFCFLCNNNLQ